MASKFSFSGNKKLYLILLLIVPLVVAAIWKSRNRKKGVEVTVERVEKRTVRERVGASGKIFPETEIKLSADVSGEIVELTVKEGDSVRAGQVLGKIRPDEYASAVERGEAAVKSAQAQRTISSSNLVGSGAQIEQLRADRNRIVAQLDAQKNIHKRNEALYASGFVSLAELENSQSNLRSLEANLAAADAAVKSAESNANSAEGNIRVSDAGISSAKATLKELRTSLAKTNIVAPVSGVISKLSVKKGERVVGTLQMAGTEMMRIANLHSMEVQVEVPENDILKVKLGDPADIEVDAYLGSIFKGKVTEIANSASNVNAAVGAVLNTDQVTNFLVKVRIDGESYKNLLKSGTQYPFRPGMSAAVEIFTNIAEGVVAVPVVAVTVLEDEDNADTKQKSESIQEIVYVAKGDSAVVRKVKSGIQDNDYIVITAGLEEGERVVAGPYSAITKKLKKGDIIQVKEKKDLKKDKEDE